MRCFIWVQPGAKRSEPAGRHGGDPKLRVAAPPREGAANEEVVAFLALALGVARREVTIVAGQGNRRKLIEYPDAANERFEALFAERS